MTSLSVPCLWGQAPGLRFGVGDAICASNGSSFCIKSGSAGCVSSNSRCPRGRTSPQQLRCGPVGAPTRAGSDELRADLSALSRIL